MEFFGGALRWRLLLLRWSLLLLRSTTSVEFFGGVLRWSLLPSMESLLLLVEVLLPSMESLLLLGLDQSLVSEIESSVGYTVEYPSDS